jgi:hypothetical protein
MPWDEIPFKLESESILYDTLFGSESASDRAPTLSVIPSSEAETFTKGEGEAVPFPFPKGDGKWKDGEGKSGGGGREVWQQGGRGVS